LETAPPIDFMAIKCHSNPGHTLLELMCVVAIIGILAGVYLGVIAKAFNHVKKVLDYLFGN
jgi:prepilin-type N-terminal cleavage/methylation domain-containing protein